MGEAGGLIGPGRGRRVRWLVVGLALLILPVGVPAQNGTNGLPVITQQPQGGRAAVKESFTFQVQASGPGPLTYQWYYKSSRLANATNASLVRTNLTTSNSGRYWVKVSNQAGTVDSEDANLTVSKTAPRELLIGTVTGQGQAEIPVLLVGNGTENLISFTLGYDAEAMGNPIFTAAEGDTTVVTTNEPGWVGVTLQRPAGETFANGSQTLGTLRLDWLSATNALQAGLLFTNELVSILARGVQGQDLLLAAYVTAGLEVLQSAPELDLQSGLFIHELQLSNPGATALTNTQVGVWGLGEDDNGQTITLFNRYVLSTVDTNGDGVNDTNSYEVQISSLPAGQVTPLIMEYYVTDHGTLPTPQYFVRLPGSKAIKTARPPTGAKVMIHSARFVDDIFVIQFNTQSGYYYYVQYAETAKELNDTKKAKTAQPKLSGTGGTVQWLDTGPPKTESRPRDAASRFYRVYQDDQ